MATIKSNFNPYQIHPVANIGLGMNDLMDPTIITDQEIADCENFAVEQGALATAPAISLWDDDPQAHTGPYWGGVTFTKSDGTALDVRQRKGILEYAYDGGTEWLPCSLPSTGSPAATVVLDQVQPTFAHLNDTLIFANGQIMMSSADGITWTARPTLPLCKVVVHNGKNRLLFLNQNVDPFRFDWSDINAPMTINANSYELIDPNNNGRVIGAGITPDGTMIVFKENAIYQVADIVDQGIIDVNFVGYATIMDHHTIVTTENSVIWAGYANIFEIIGGQIRTIAGRISWTGRNDVVRSELFCGAYYNSKYHLSIPDRNVSPDYNAQEYVIYHNIPRQDAVQPYAITRNRRYIGTYYTADYAMIDGGRDISLMIGDSRPDMTAGSPAQYVNTICAWVNDYRDQDYVNESQDCYFVSKYFTEDMAFYAKKYKKLFAYMKLLATETFTFSYRFVPYGAWVDTTATITSGQMPFLEGFSFSEGFGFAQDTVGAQFIDINNPDRPRGIQFKLSVTTANDISNLSLAFSYITKPKFR